MPSPASRALTNKRSGLLNVVGHEHRVVVPFAGVRDLRDRDALGIEAVHALEVEALKETGGWGWRRKNRPWRGLHRSEGRDRHHR